MTPVRAAAALAAILTSLLLQASVVAPAALASAVSLPAVLVAVVALHDGPSTGMSLGFSAGLLADLGTDHAAGVLALSWLGVGVVCGMAVDSERRLAARALVAGAVCGLASLLSGVLLFVLGANGAAGTAVHAMLPTVAGDALLGALAIPVVGFFLRSQALRRPSAVTARG